jgi:hypothetical protein
MMESDAQRESQRRVDRIAAFRAELAELERAQALVLTPEQRVRLDAHLDGVLATLAQQSGVDVTESSRRISWGMRVAALLGGAALFAAAILFLHRIWGSLPAVTYPLILAAPPLILLALTEVSARRRAGLYYTTLLALAAGVGFAVQLVALAGVGNLTPSPHVLLAWAGFAIPVAYAYGVRLVLAAGLLLLCSYTAALGISLQGGFWGEFIQRPEFLVPTAAGCYALPSLLPHRALTGFDFVYRGCGAATVCLAFLILATTGQTCCLDLPPRRVETLYQFAGLLVSTGVVIHGLRLGRGGLVNLGALAFVVFLYVRLHAWWWDWMPKYLFFLLIGLTAIVLVLVFRRLRGRLLGKVAA